ncbi:hypothetical protein FBUS_04618, partial [Fasciolopsis buskii]
FIPRVQPHSSNVTDRVTLFDWLHRRATNLLDRIARYSPSAPGDEPGEHESTSTDESAPPSPALLSRNPQGISTVRVNSETTEPSSRFSRVPSEGKPTSPAESAGDSVPGFSPMHVDGNPEDNSGSASRSATDNLVPDPTSGEHENTENNSVDHPLSTLADMLSRHRQLWRSAEPYLTQWENMINSEDFVQQTLRSERHNTEADRVEPSDQMPDETTEISPDSKTNETTQTFSPPARTAVPEGLRDSLSDHSWHHHFFLQVSRLLHLHAHMLHLISDFYIIPHSPEGNHIDVAASSGVTTTSHNASTEATRSPSSSDVPAKCPQSESASHCRRRGLYAHPRTRYDPFDSSGLHHMMSRILIPESRNRANVSSSTDRQRNQSPAAPQDQCETGNQESIPTVASTEATPTVGLPALSTAVRSGPVGVRGAAVMYHPSPMYEVMSTPGRPAPVSTQATTTTTTLSPAAVTIRSSFPTYYYMPLGFEAQSTANTTTVGSTLPRSTTQPMPTLHTASLTDPDPFLPCNSPHFTHERSRATARHSVPVVQLSAPPSMVTTVLGSRPVYAASGTPNANVTVPTTQPATVNSTSQSTTTTTTTSTGSATTRGESNFQLPQGLNIPHQIALLFSAASNAAASAISNSGLHAGHSPVNVLFSSTPVQFTIDISRPHTGTPADPSLVTPNTRTTTTDSSRQNQSSRLRDPSGTPLPVPTWANVHGETTSSGPPTAPSSLTLFIESLIEAVWLQLSNLACEDGIDLNAVSNVWRPSRAAVRHSSNEFISSGFLNDVLSAVQSELSPTNDSDSTPSAGVSFATRLDGMRTRLTYLLCFADGAIRRLSENCLTGGLVNLLFGGCTSDGETPPSNSFERRSIGWVCHRISNDREIIDVRASLANVFRTWLSSLLDFCRDYRFGIAFGPTLTSTLFNFCVHLICTVDVLSMQLASASRLSTLPNSRPNATNFQSIVNRLRQFADDSRSERERLLCDRMCNEVRNAISAYCNYTEERLRGIRHQVSNSFIVRRSLDVLSTGDVEMETRPVHMEHCAVDESDLDDLPFVDASSELSVNGTEKPVSVSPLPNGIPKPEEIPEPLSRALDPHPDSACSLMDTNTTTNLPNPEGWHAILPAEWLRVVTGDVTNMNQTTASEDSSSDQLQRFSDAYIAGMPAKRRKIMTEHSKFIAQPPHVMLTECLSDAVKASGFKATTEAGSVTTGCIPTAPGTDTSSSRIDLVLSLRDLVSERIANRLSADPDFDPTQFPLSYEAFLKKHSKNH